MRFIFILFLFIGHVEYFAERTLAFQNEISEVKQFDNALDDKANIVSNDVNDKQNKSSSGIEVRIPGIGHLGTLPKLDFGLELIYGAEEKKDDTQEDVDDLSIHTTVKHRF